MTDKIKLLRNLNYILLSTFIVAWLGVLTNQLTLKMDLIYGSFVGYCAVLWMLDKWYVRPALKYTKKPIWLELTAGMFWVIFGALILRTCFMELIWVPTGSMLPTIQLGDLLYVSKSAYELKVPLSDKVLWKNEVERGDVIVFNYPPDPSIAYIKRVVAVPGDTVSYNANYKNLTINGIVQEKLPGTVPSAELKDLKDVSIYKTNLGATSFFLADSNNIHRKIEFKPTYGQQNCTATDTVLTCRIPEGYYFVLGDNRDNSQDSRYWGLARYQDIKGKARFVLLSSVLTHIGWLR